MFLSPNDSPRDTDVLTRTEAAKMLGVKPQTLAKWQATHRYGLPAIKYGKRSVGYLRSDVLAFRDKHRELNGATGK